MMSLSVICMSCGNREGVSGLPCSTLKNVTSSHLFQRLYGDGDRKCWAGSVSRTFLNSLTHSLLLQPAVHVVAPVSINVLNPRLNVV